MTLQHRPGLGVRSAIALLAFGILLTNATLLLSDRAPRVLHNIFGDFVRRITQRLDADASAEATLRARDIGGDSIVHFGLWAVAMLVVGLAVWAWAELLIASSTVAAISLVLEVAQGRYSSTRAVEAIDAAFNLLGVAVGAGAAAAVYVTVDGLGRLVKASD